MGEKQRKYAGVLKLLGNSISGAGGTKYSIIEIGGDSIADVRVCNAMDNYLHRAFDGVAETTIWVRGSTIICLAFDDKAYVADCRWGTGMKIWACVLGICTIGIFGIGLYVIYKTFSLSSQRANEHESFLKQYPSATVFKDPFSGG